jgi:hypothetical protein
MNVKVSVSLLQRINDAAKKLAATKTDLVLAC